eukprot:scaffold7_cov378-Prasinococcus_capsulatus_cf.AAC.6
MCSYKIPSSKPLGGAAPVHGRRPLPWENRGGSPAVTGLGAGPRASNPRLGLGLHLTAHFARRRRAHHAHVDDDHHQQQQHARRAHGPH